MTEQDAFLQAIRAAPEDNGPRLMYADWLTERGAPQGEFLRVQCAVSDAVAATPTIHKFATKYRTLLRQPQIDDNSYAMRRLLDKISLHCKRSPDDAFLRLRDLELRLLKERRLHRSKRGFSSNGILYDRGILACMVGAAENFPDEVEYGALLDGMPEKLVLQGAAGHIQRIVKTATFALMHSVTFRQQTFPSPSHREITAIECEALAQSTSETLEELTIVNHHVHPNVWGGHCSDHAIHPFIRAKHLDHLHTLRFVGQRITPCGVYHFLKNTRLKLCNLEILENHARFEDLTTENRTALDALLKKRNMRMTVTACSQEDCTYHQW